MLYFVILKTEIVKFHVVTTLNYIDDKSPSCSDDNLIVYGMYNNILQASCSRYASMRRSVIMNYVVPMHLL